ncbi:MAG: RnfABCDGE type electron transport complex subunit G [Oscillospiraceae bacterium]|nr:RnfABCDGE type electron transport complex subunit G [Oscillospiraceae bacterium]
MKKIVIDTLKLLAITLVAGVLLSVVYQLTKDTIAEAEAKELTDSYSAVMSDASDFVEIESPETEAFGEDNTLNTALYAYDSEGNEIGTVLSVTSHKGYGGDIDITIGIDTTGTITGIVVTSMSETSGLGANCQNEEWISQYIGKSGEVAYTKTGATQENEIDAISGATKTTRAITNAVNAALDFASDYFGYGEGGGNS